MAKRLGYAAIGFVIGLVIAFAAGKMLGKPFGVGSIGLSLVCSTLAIAIAEKLGKIKSAEELSRPQTLFQDRK